MRQAVTKNADCQFLVEQIQPTPLGSTENDFCVTVDLDQTHQTLDGFGASFTDSAAYLMHRVLDEQTRKDAMDLLFDPEKGIGLSLLRNPMGASDYARTIYSYDDMPEGEVDPNLDHFSVAHDEESIIPLTKEAIRINPRIKVFSSPWSAPGWMKTSGKMVTGELRREYYAAYANYFVRYIQSYEEHGISIYGVSPQNEPLYVPGHYPGMLMTATDQLVFVRDHLHPALRKANLNTRIYGYDHNWDSVDYPYLLLDSAKECFAGIAWHWYGGSPVSQSRVQRDYPDKEMHLFEASGGSWIPSFEPGFSNLMRTGINILRNGSKSLILWNMALDENRGPTVPGFGESTCRGVLRVDQDSKTFTTTIDYTGLAHFSKFTRPGSKRVESTQEGPIHSVAFTNPNGTLTIIVFNDSESTESVSIKLKTPGSSKETTFHHAELDPKSALTLEIDPEETRK